MNERLVRKNWNRTDYSNWYRAMKSISIWFCIYFVYSKDDLTPYLTNRHLTDILPLHYPALGILLGHDRWAEPTSVSPVHTDIHLVTNTVMNHQVFICYHIHQYLVLPHISVSSNTYLILPYVPVSIVLLYTSIYWCLTWQHLLP